MELIFVTCRLKAATIVECPVSGSHQLPCTAQSIANGDLQVEPSRAEIEAAARGAGADEVIARLPKVTTHC